MQVPHLSRREFLGAAAAALATASAHSSQVSLRTISDLEQEVGGRIGLAALNTANGRRLVYRAHERFSMCSTFKLMLAVAVLARIDAGILQLDQSLTFGRSDLLPTSPVGDAHPDGGAVPLEEMLESVIEASDNTAANLLLALIGGPSSYTAYLRSIGDDATRLDRTELDLNSNLVGDPRDTTTPIAMLEDLHRVIMDGILSVKARQKLLGWMRDCKTGRERLRARISPSWDVGDKTGTGARGAVNDLAVFYPPRQRPIIIACYLSDSSASTDILDGAHARIGEFVASTITRDGTGRSVLQRSCQPR